MPKRSPRQRRLSSFESTQRHDPEIIECDCGRQFDLARQNYYGEKCPQCREERPDG